MIQPATLPRFADILICTVQGPQHWEEGGGKAGRPDRWRARRTVPLFKSQLMNTISIELRS